PHRQPGLPLFPYTTLFRSCVNIANVLLARFTARAYEIGVRLTLGASRRRLVQQFLVESALLSAMAAAAGLVLAFWMQRALHPKRDRKSTRLNSSHVAISYA